MSQPSWQALCLPSTTSGKPQNKVVGTRPKGGHDERVKALTANNLNPPHHYLKRRGHYLNACRYSPQSGSNPYPAAFTNKHPGHTPPGRPGLSW